MYTTENTSAVPSQPDSAPALGTDTLQAVEAAVFRRLLEHLDSRKDVQNIDLMNLAGFCRNCLSKWYRAEAGKRGLEVSDDAARERIYGMPYGEWKAHWQKEASREQLQQFDQRKPD